MKRAIALLLSSIMFICILPVVGHAVSGTPTPWLVGVHNTYTVSMENEIMMLDVTDTVLPEELELSFSGADVMLSGTPTKAGEYTIMFKVIYENGNMDDGEIILTVKEQELVEPTAIKATIIAPRNIEKIYDGEAYSINTGDIAFEGLLEGHYPDCKVRFMLDGVETEPIGVGDYVIALCDVIIRDGEGRDCTALYELTITDGALSIYEENPADKIKITVIAAGETWIYDGETHSAPYVILEGEWEENHTILAETNEAEITDAGTVEHTVIKVTAQDNEGNDVSGEYDFIIQNGILTVKQRPVKAVAESAVITSPDAQEEIEACSINGLVEGHCAETEVSLFNETGEKVNSISAPGTYGKKITALAIHNADGEDVTANYSVEFIDGTITYDEIAEDSLSVIVPGVSAGETVYVDGEAFTVTDDGRLYLPDDTKKVVTQYSLANAGSSDPHTVYPTGMAVWKLNHDGEAYSCERLEGLDNILQYSGSSIRIVGVKGIRMITSIPSEGRNSLIKTGLEGFKLKEYGTAVAWAAELGGAELTLEHPAAKSNYAYKRGVSDPIFAEANGLTQYTNVLTGFKNEQCKPDLVMRPYMKLEDENGKEMIVYGGSVQRSIGYIAWQNRNAFTPGSEAYKYIWDIIHYVYGDIYDSEYKG